MRLIDADALMADCQLAQNQADRRGREFANAFYSGGGEVSTEWWCVEDMIENAPTIEPGRGNGYRDGYKRGKRAGYKKGREVGRKTGQWIRIPHDGIYCTTCKKGWSFMLGAPGDIENYHYCPHCGARMEEGEQ